MKSTAVLSFIVFWVGTIFAQSLGGDGPPEVTSTTPANGAANVAQDANLTITFSEPVNVSGAWFDITCTVSGAHTAVVSGGPQTFMLDPDIDFAGNESCTVTVFAIQVTDQDTDDPPDNMDTDFNWSFTTVGVVSVEDTSRADTPRGFALGQNYPNPFNPSTTISFSLPRSQFVTLRVFNIMGEQVATLVSNKISAGTHQIEWDAKGFPSGVYFSRLQTSSFSQTKKLVLLR